MANAILNLLVLDMVETDDMASLALFLKHLPSDSDFSSCECDYTSSEEDTELEFQEILTTKDMTVAEQNKGSNSAAPLIEGKTEPDILKLQYKEVTHADTHDEVKLLDKRQSVFLKPRLNKEMPSEIMKPRQEDIVIHKGLPKPVFREKFKMRIALKSLNGENQENISSNWETSHETEKAMLDTEEERVGKGREQSMETSLDSVQMKSSSYPSDISTSEGEMKNNEGEMKNKVDKQQPLQARHTDMNTSSDLPIPLQEVGRTRSRKVPKTAQNQTTKKHGNTSQRKACKKKVDCDPEWMPPQSFEKKVIKRTSKDLQDPFGTQLLDGDQWHHMYSKKRWRKPAWLNHKTTNHNDPSSIILDDEVSGRRPMAESHRKRTQVPPLITASNSAWVQKKYIGRENRGHCYNTQYSNASCPKNPRNRPNIHTKPKYANNSLSNWHNSLIPVKKSPRDNEEFQCQQCNYTTWYKLGMKKHLKLHRLHRPSVTCPDCQIVFSNELAMSKWHKTNGVEHKKSTTITKADAEMPIQHVENEVSEMPITNGEEHKTLIYNGEVNKIPITKPGVKRSAIDGSATTSCSMKDRKLDVTNDGTRTKGDMELMDAAGDANGTNNKDSGGKNTNEKGDNDENDNDASDGTSKPTKDGNNNDLGGSGTGDNNRGNEDDGEEEDDDGKDGNINMKNAGQDKNVELLPCLICPERYSKKQDLMKHLTKIHRMINLCQICYFDANEIRRFANAVSLRNHKVRDHPEDMVKCVCGAMLIDYKTLTNHLKKFKCNLKEDGSQVDDLVRCVCGKRFASKALVQAHKSKCRKRFLPEDYSTQLDDEYKSPAAKKSIATSKRVTRSKNVPVASSSTTKDGKQDKREVNNTGKSSKAYKPKFRVDMINIEDVSDEKAQETPEKEPEPIPARRQQRGRKCKDLIESYCHKKFDQAVTCGVKTSNDKKSDNKTAKNGDTGNSVSKVATSKMPMPIPKKRMKYALDNADKYTGGVKIDANGNILDLGNSMNIPQGFVSNPAGPSKSYTDEFILFQNTYMLNECYNPAGFDPNNNAPATANVYRSTIGRRSSTATCTWSSHTTDVDYSMASELSKPGSNLDIPSTSGSTPYKVDLRKRSRPSNLDANNNQLASNLNSDAGVPKTATLDEVIQNVDWCKKYMCEPDMSKPFDWGFSWPRMKKPRKPKFDLGLSSKPTSSTVPAPLDSPPPRTKYGKSLEAANFDMEPNLEHTTAPTSMSALPPVAGTSSSRPVKKTKTKAATTKRKPASSTASKSTSASKSTKKADAGAKKKKGKRAKKPDADGRYPCKTCRKRYKRPYLYVHQKQAHAKKMWVYVGPPKPRAKPRKSYDWMDW